jgi:outer membrane protein OmpA-like peptidoglycan-associated protein
MHLSEYGSFASIIAVAAALVSVFSLLLLKAVGRVKQWTWLIHDTPPFLVTAGPRALAVALIAVTFLLINKNNYLLFVIAAVIFGVLMVVLIGWFDRLRKVHIYKVPQVQADGSPAVDRRKPLFKTLVIGNESDMNAAAKRAFAEARRRHGGLSLIDFMSGYGATGTNNPEALWSRAQLAQISNRMTMCLMGILLCGVMALYLSASSIEVKQRREPVATQAEKTEPPPTQQAAPAPPAAATPPKEADSTGVKGAEPTTGRERESSVTTTAAASGEFFKKKLPNGVELNILSSGIEANLLVFLENKAKPERVTWFDFDRLQFETGKTTPQVSSREQLQNIAHILAAYPSVKAMIGGYTDNVGNPGTNKRLSKARADSVRRELTRMGVEASRISAKGYGESHPIATNDTEEGHAQNRRISLGVTQK